MDFDGDAAGFDMGQGMNFGSGNGGTRVFMNGQDMSGMGIDPNQIFSMFFNQGGAGSDDDFGFGSFGMGGMGARMRGNNKENHSQKSNRGSSKAKFGGFGGFPNFGGFSQQANGFN